jgi:membrane associated rhomboid family serine protease
MRGAPEIRFMGPPGWRRLPPVTRVTLLLAAAGYLATLIWPVFGTWVGVAPSAVVGGLQLWRLVTYPLGIVGIFNVLFDLLLLWQFGSELESGWGPGRYAAFLLACTLVAGTVGVLATLGIARSSPFSLGFAGMAGVITAMIVAWALRGPDLPANLFGLLPMTRRGFAILAVVLVVFGDLEQTRSLPRLFYLLGGLPVAWWFTRGGRRGGMTLPRPSRLFRRSRFRVVRGGDRVH